MKFALGKWENPVTIPETILRVFGKDLLLATDLRPNRISFRGELSSRRLPLSSARCFFIYLELN